MILEGKLLGNRYEILKKVGNERERTQSEKCSDLG